MDTELDNLIITIEKLDYIMDSIKTMPIEQDVKLDICKYITRRCLGKVLKKNRNSVKISNSNLGSIP